MRTVQQYVQYYSVHGLSATLQIEQLTMPGGEDIYGMQLVRLLMKLCTESLRLLTIKVISSLLSLNSNVASGQRYPEI